MKKLFLTLGLITMTSASFAQGWVLWTTTANAITAQTNTAISPLFGGSGTGGTVGPTASPPSGLVYYYELLYQTWNGSITMDTTVWDGTWLDTGFIATNGTVAAGRLVPVNSGNRQVPWAHGTTMNIVLVGWSSNLGTSWSTVSSTLFDIATGTGSSAVYDGSAFFGESNFGYINPNTDQPGAVLFTTSATANGLPINSLNTQLYQLPIPEPATMALVGLGGLALLYLRRRK